MSPPTVRVNTFVGNNENSLVDSLSKVYITGEMIFGMNRLNVFNEIKPIYKILAHIYSFCLCMIILYVSFFMNKFSIYEFEVEMSLLEYLFCVIYNCVTCKKLLRFYNELNKFDNEVGCRPKVMSSSIKNFINLCGTVVVVTIFFIVPSNGLIMGQLTLQMIPVHLVHVIQLHYYGHLLNLLTPRLRLINYYMDMSLSNIKAASSPKVDEFIYFKNYENNKSNCEIKKLLDLYHIIVNAYDFLINAIKWQLLVIIVTSFASVLSFSYNVSLSIIRSSKSFLHIVSDTGLTVAEIVVLFAPCIFGDRVHGEVRHFRELLASRLYENKLDKSSRSTARALLSLTEARNLSFSLFRMFDIDISLPFKFIELLVTYLIILLQFEKVINPN